MAMLDVTSSVGGILSLALYVALAVVLHRVLCSMARNNARAQAAALASAFGKDTTQLELEEEDTSATTTTTSTTAKEAKGDYVQAGNDGDDDDDACSVASSAPKPQHSPLSSTPTLSKEDRLAITIRLVLLLLLHYLLLVYLPGGALASFVGALAVAGLTLAPYLSDDLLRHNRWDRLVTILALVVWIAAAATALTYHRLTFTHGPVYAGPARIVGYDTDNYVNADGTTLRADLQVAWGGGAWACPGSGECEASVQGALCQAKYNTTETRRGRKLEDGIVYADDDEVAAEEEEFVEEVVEEAEEEVVEYEDEVVEEADMEVVEYEDELDEVYEEEETVDAEEVGEVEEEEEELEEEKEELEKENEELEEELEEEEDEAEELEEEIEDIEYDYEYEDDYYDSDYWAGYDWNSVWGEYACEDLFAEDMDGLGYNADVPAGQDDWPTVQIYGTCRSCEAFIMDYYSTEHYLTIQQYIVQAYAYGLLGTVLMIAAAICTQRERLRPSQDTQIILLSEDGGVMA